MDPSTNTPLQPYLPPDGSTPAPGQNMSNAVGGPAPYVPPIPSMPPLVPAYPAVSNTQPSLGAIPPPLPPISPNPLAGNVKQELVEHLRKANNVLVTVSSNPSIDQLSAAIGITLILNKLDKHATAVYSGDTPPTLEFLQPAKTIEKNTDSLRDFIIALDKAKADKLRYKVEDTFVKIFITPYHTSLSESDLEFSQGDFNVDVVLALGVHQREELDQAITAHGRILHDAVTVSINNNQPSELGAINWFQSEASSLCEMLVELVEPLQGDKILLDSQIATAFLTGVVAETERFSNAKTTPMTMNVSAMLMKAGANQQLVSSKLQEPEAIPKASEFDGKKLDELANEKAVTPTASKDGSLAIEHKKSESAPASKSLQDLEKENNEVSDGTEDSNLAKIHIDDEGTLVPAEKTPATPVAPVAPPISSNMIMQPPSLGGDLSATTREDTSEVDQPSVDAPPTDLSQSQHAKTISPLTEQEKTQTLADLEKAVDSSHLNEVGPLEDTSADSARAAIQQADASMAPNRLEPIDALNAQPVDLSQESSAPAPVAESTPVPAPTPSGDLTTEDVFPTQLIGPDTGLPPDPTAGATDPSAPPPVPPPLMPPTM